MLFMNDNIRNSSNSKSHFFSKQNIQEIHSGIQDSDNFDCIIFCPIENWIIVCEYEFVISGETDIALYGVYVLTNPTSNVKKGETLSSFFEFLTKNIDIEHRKVPT